MKLIYYIQSIVLTCFYSVAFAQSDSVKVMLTQINGSMNNKVVAITNTNNKIIGITKKAFDEADSITQNLQNLPEEYIKQIDDKIDKYSDRIIGKTEKTLLKLSKWENKIKPLLEKASPQTADKLFGKNAITFTSLLQQLQEGKSIATKYRASYHSYTDKLSTSLKYLQEHKDKVAVNLVKPIEEVNEKMEELSDQMKDSEVIEKIIKERKKQLAEAALKYIGNSKYIKKINKEAWYYVETMKNYKQIFSDPEKTEETAMAILNKIPMFQSFMKENSQLASMFGRPSANVDMQSLAGLQTRAVVQNLIQTQIAQGGPDAKQLVSQNMQQAQSELTKLKDKINKAGGGGSDAEMPDFKPNMQKTKTFLQRMEYGFNVQFAKNSEFLPTTADVALTAGYKLNDKSIIGIGASYKIGFGSLEKIQVTHQGIGLRSFLDWKLKKQFYISGGFEMNHNDTFKDFVSLRGAEAWQRSALMGITKKFAVKTKFTKTTNIQLLYDFLSRQHVPFSQPFLFRVGYVM